jgi:hypothetical protein
MTTPPHTTVPPADPLALDPYSPTLPTHAPEQNDPLSLDPYSPIVPTRARADQRTEGK